MVMFVEFICKELCDLEKLKFKFDGGYLYEVIVFCICIF